MKAENEPIVGPLVAGNPPFIDPSITNGPANGPVVENNSGLAQVLLAKGIITQAEFDNIGTGPVYGVPGYGAPVRYTGLTGSPVIPGEMTASVHTKVYSSGVVTHTANFYKDGACVGTRDLDGPLFDEVINNLGEHAPDGHTFLTPTVLPDGFPSKAELAAHGVTTYDELEALFATGTPNTPWFGTVAGLDDAKGAAIVVAFNDGRKVFEPYRIDPADPAIDIYGRAKLPGGQVPLTAPSGSPIDTSFFPAPMQRLGPRAATFVPPPPPPVDNLHVAPGATPFEEAPPFGAESKTFEINEINTPLPADFPALAQLQAAGITTYVGLRLARRPIVNIDTATQAEIDARQNEK